MAGNSSGAKPALVADENVPRPVLDRLRADGWDVDAITDLAPGSPDEQVLARANLERKVLLTQDRDFGELAFSSKLPVAGIVLFELERLSLASQADRLSTVLVAERDGLDGCFLVVEPARVRHRALPDPVERP